MVSSYSVRLCLTVIAGILLSNTSRINTLPISGKNSLLNVTDTSKTHVSTAVSSSSNPLATRMPSFQAYSDISLKPIDIVVLKKLSDVVNVVPVIAKSDSLTLAERQAFKQRVSLPGPLINNRSKQNSPSITLKCTPTTTTNSTKKNAPSTPKSRSVPLFPHSPILHPLLETFHALLRTALTSRTASPSQSSAPKRQ